MKACGPDLIRPYVERAADFDTGGLDTTDEWLTGGESLAVSVDGDLVGGIVVERHAYAAGAVCWITAAACEPVKGLRHIRDVLPLIEQQAKRAGCAQVAAQTVRPELVRALKASGYELAGYIVRKAV